MFFVAALWNFAADAPALIFYERQFKLIFAFFTDALLRGHATATGWVVPIGDLLWAAGFFWFLHRNRDGVRVNNLVG